jgi:hypothetical protein
MKYTLAVNGPMRSVKVSGTELNKILITPLGLRAKARDLFYEANPDARMDARIITGNLLGAYGALKGVKGRIISFTKADGTREIGILMPKKFDPKTNVVNEYCLRSPEAALKTVKAYDSAGPAISAPGGDVQVQKESVGIIIKTKTSKAAGGKYFLDPQLRGMILNGEFYARGGWMVGHVLAGQEIPAIKLLMSKGALYATASMIDRAREFDEKESQPQLMPPEPPKPTGGAPKPKGGSSVTMSMLGTGALNDYAEKAIPATWNELVKFVGASGKSAKKMGYEFASAFMPGALADADAKDIMGHAIGEPALRMFQASQFLAGVKKMFEGMPIEKQVAFIDRWQNGRPQPSSDLQQAQEFMQEVIDQQRQRENEAVNLGRDEDDQLELSQKENYFPNRYKKAPDGEKLFSEDEQVQRLHGMSRRPFEGNKAFLKQQKYTMKEAVAKGAVPLGDPVDILMRRLQEGAKFVAAKYAMHNFKEQGLVVFLKNGKKMPEGYEEINDKIAKVWRPVETEKGGTLFVQSGKWVGQKDAVRLLNNYLSTDFWRGLEIGAGLIKLKNVTTEMRLALSPFHFGYITVENFASGLNIGLDKFYNQGVRDLSPSKMAAGMEEIGKALISPFTAVRVGGQMIDFARNPDEYLASPEGQRFAKLYPDFPRLMRLLFHGGLRWDMADTFKGSFGDGFLEAMKGGELGKAILKSIPWVAHTIMRPLFEHYIPRSKWVFAVNMLSSKLDQYSQALAAGTITEETIARDVAMTTDNRFGEFNWDALWLNNTLRTGSQFFFRSATWKIGSWRGLVQAGQEAFSSKAFDDRIFEKIDEEERKYQWVRNATRKLPQLGMNAGWLLSMSIATAVMGSVISRLASGKWPWEWAEQATNGYSKWGNAALEAMHPRTGEVDTHGQPIRVSFPTGLKDYEHGLSEPGRYIKGSVSDVAGNAWDTLQNRDVFGNYVYNPNDKLTKELLQGMIYNLRGDFIPISASNYARQYGPQDALSKLERFSGMVGGAPKELDQSAALSKALSEVKHEAHTPEDEEAYQLAKGQPATRQQILKAARERNFTYLEKVVLHELTYTQAKEIYEKYATPQEKQQLKGILDRKRTLEILKARRR